MVYKKKKKPPVNCPCLSASALVVRCGPCLLPTDSWDRLQHPCSATQCRWLFTVITHLLRANLPLKGHTAKAAVEANSPLTCFAGSSDIMSSGGGMAIVRLGGFLLFRRLSDWPLFGGGSSPPCDAIVSEC